MGSIQGTFVGIYYDFFLVFVVFLALQIKNLCL